MLDDLTPPQRQLADFMSAVSEEAYGAGWMVELEYVLWDALTGGALAYGGLDLGHDQRAELRRLSEACAGWVVFDEPAGETWLPRVEWERRFAGWKQRQPTLLRLDV